MSLQRLCDDLQNGLEQRHDEIIRLKKVFGPEFADSSNDMHRRPLVLLCYAHTEGFAVFALREYAKAVSQLRLRCNEANPQVVAGAWSEVFAGLSGSDKIQEFNNNLPNDTDLHHHGRRKNFVSSIRSLDNLPVIIPEKAINSDSNISAWVLKRNLYVIGIPHDFVNQFSGVLEDLRKTRNKIAHGEDINGVSHKNYNRLEDAFF